MLRAPLREFLFSPGSWYNVPVLHVPKKNAVLLHLGHSILLVFSCHLSRDGSTISEE
jgi:hypothetical protein